MINAIENLKNFKILQYTIINSQNITNIDSHNMKFHG